MKKAKWLCLLFVCLLLLPACGGKGEGGGKGQPPALPAEFEADMTAVISEQTIKAHIDVYKRQTLTSPLNAAAG